jgi:predicted transcriptional regulator
MAYGVTDKATALKMYLDGKSVNEIAEILGLAYPTVYDWYKNDKWAKKKERVNDKLQEAVIDDLVEYKKKKLEELEYMVQFLNKEMETCKNPTKDKLANNIIELQKLIMSIQGIQIDSSKSIKVEHGGKINVKLEDLV